MRIFDTNVQLLKYKTLKELIIHLDNNSMENIYMDIPRTIVTGQKATMRCCIYKERAILQERIKLALGGNKANPNVIEIIDIACDECPVDGIMITGACRGCIQHPCKENCPKNAITIIDKKAVINKDKCIECGKCVKVCPYNAIIQQHRPCVLSCKANAISMNDDKQAIINDDKCIACGACVYQCPFGAIQDKSFITETYDILKKGKIEDYKVYAVIAPSIVSQFKYAKVGQVVSGILKLGFHQVVEAALGADITLHQEIKEWQHKGKMTTSCCPSFVMYVEKNFPELKHLVSSSVSPMVWTAKLIKNTDPTAKVIFIGPCTSKKMEYKMEKVEGAIDSVISFEELQAFLDARKIDVATLDENLLDNASYYGRIFAKSGGIAQGITEVSKSMGIDGVKAVTMNGISECKLNLLKLKMGKSADNFFEGMACEGGCLNGALCLSHSQKNFCDIDEYGNQAKEKDIANSVKLYELHGKLD